jgi:hypothetical protein
LEVKQLRKIIFGKEQGNRICLDASMPQEWEMRLTWRRTGGCDASGR